MVIPEQQVNNTDMNKTPENPVEEPVKEAKKLTRIWEIAFFIVLFIGVVTVMVLLKSLAPKPSVVVITPTAAPNSPTPIRESNPVASSSAFMELDARITDLNKQINTYSIADTNLNPPVLDLPLGFSSR